MKIPADAHTFEGELATFWLDGEGILCALSKSTPRNLVRQKRNYALIREITGGRRVCLLTDTSSSSEQDKETRDYTALEMPRHFHAMAVLSDSAGGRMMANLFMAIKNSPIPIMLFSDEQEARQWLKQFSE